MACSELPCSATCLLRLFKRSSANLEAEARHPFESWRGKLKISMEILERRFEGYHSSLNEWMSLTCFFLSKKLPIPWGRTVDRAEVVQEGGAGAAVGGNSTKPDKRYRFFLSHNQTCCSCTRPGQNYNSLTPDHWSVTKRCCTQTPRRENCNRSHQVSLPSFYSLTVA